MRDQPSGVRRIAMEAAAELVVDPAIGHRLERPERDRRASARRPSPRAGAAGTRSSSAAGTSGAPPQPPLRGIERGRDPGRRRVEQRLGRRVLGRRRLELLLLDQAARPAASPPPRPGRAARATPGPRRPAPAGTTASRDAARPGSTCRRRTADRRASGTRSSASRRCRSSPGPPPCRPGRGRAAPRDPP